MVVSREWRWSAQLRSAALLQSVLSLKASAVCSRQAKMMSSICVARSCRGAERQKPVWASDLQGSSSACGALCCRCCCRCCCCAPPLCCVATPPPPFTHPLYSKPSTNPTDDRVPQAVGARHQRRRRRVRVCRRRRFGEHPSAPHRGGLRKGGRRRQRQGGGQVILRTRAPLPPRCRQCQCSRPRRVQRPRPFPPARAPPRRAGEKQLVQPRERLRARAALGSQSIVPQFFLPY